MAAAPRPALRVLCAAALWCGLSACRERGIVVTVELDGGSTQCIRVVAFPLKADGGEVFSQAIAVQGKSTLTVAVFKGTLADDARAFARGYDTPTCEQLNEQSAAKPLPFADPSEPVTLNLWGSVCATLAVGSACAGGRCRPDGGCIDAGEELDCGDGLDDNGNGLADCLDSSCYAHSCSAGECLAGGKCLMDAGCGGGTPTPCTTPKGACYDAPGTCNPTTGACTYPVDLTNACSDGDSCTVDACVANGTCQGTSAPCPPPTACQLANACNGLGGCTPTLRNDGDPCPAGYCRTGSCVTFRYTPSNFSPTLVASGGIAPAIQINCPTAFDTTSLAATGWCPSQPLPVASVVMQTSGVEAVVLAMRGLNLTATGSLTLTGSRPAILAVWGDATVDGTISARSILGAAAGAGGNVPGCFGGNLPGIVGGGGAGGGGGGFGLAGGTGGGFLWAPPAPLGGTAGASNGNMTLVPLRGGCRGGAGGLGNPVGSGSDGGSGGGAVQLSAAGQLQISGVVTASGGGGQEGVSSRNGGGGGGSGGAVLLEGQTVIISNGALTANGGSGGEASGDAGMAGAPGTDGSPTSNAPVNSTPVSTNGGNGGAGGAALGPALPGEIGNTGGGGGGGGVGRIRINAPATGTCTVSGGLRSPIATGAGACPPSIP